MEKQVRNGPAGADRRPIMAGAGVFAACLAAAYLGRFPFLTAGLLGAAGALSVGYAMAKQRAHGVLSVLVVALVSFLLSGLAVGSVRPGDLVRMAFWGGDGRVILYYMPLLFFSVMKVDTGILASFVRVGLVLAVVTLGLFGAFLLGVVPGQNFEGFLTHHIGAGSFFAVLCIFLVVYGWESGANVIRALGLLMILPAAAAGSRMVLGALPLVLVVYVVRRRRSAEIAILSGLLAAVVVAVPFVAPWTVERMLPLLRDPPFGAIATALETIQWKAPQDPRAWGGEHWNVVWRFIYWRRGVELFLDSPLLGAGFGRYDDLFVHYSGWQGLVYMGTDGVRNFSPLHAHNSLLHFLAETGIVGTGLMAYVWYTLWSRIRSVKDAVLSPSRARHYAAACEHVLYFVLVLSLLTHSMAAPSLGLIAMPLLGALLALRVTSSDLTSVQVRRGRAKLAMSPPPAGE